MIGTVITYKTKFGTLYQGHVLDILKELPNESVDCIITSPPYWSLRDYGKQTNVIWGGDPNCKHEWILYNDKKSAFCGKCGAWYGQLGLEPTLDLYIEHLIWIMKELKRVLKKTGVIFWNHGDCYSSSGKGYGSVDPKYPSARNTRNSVRPNRSKIDIPQKCMCLQNYRFVLRCIDELGLILRNIVIWYKPNHMPSSVKDRFTAAYEPVFMLVKSKKYWFDLDAVRIPHKTENLKEHPLNHKDWENTEFNKRGKGAIVKPNPLGKNPGDVWVIPTQPFPEAHFATFPRKLVEPMIKAGCPQWICKKCGRARVRITKPTEEYSKKLGKSWHNHREDMVVGAGQKCDGGTTASYITIGWTDCGCNAGWVSGVVLDPFMGSGTVAVVAERLNRRWIGIELNEEYCEIAKKRLKKTIPKFCYN